MTVRGTVSPDSWWKRRRTCVFLSPQKTPSHSWGQTTLTSPRYELSGSMTPLLPHNRHTNLDKEGLHWWTKSGREEVLGGEVFAVQTRRQQERRQQQQKDDEASAASGAVPLDLATLDDNLFGITKERRRLTRNQKHAQARDKGRDEEKLSDLQLTEVTSKKLEEA